jgi:hypothetical protein
MDQLTLARLHGLFNAANGLWPLAHMRSFEHVFGPKHDKWLVRTVAGLLLANGVVQAAAPDSQEALAQARRVGIGTAATLAAIDVIYASPGRISRIYLLDAATELGWILLWLRVSRTHGHKPPRS